MNARAQYNVRLLALAWHGVMLVPVRARPFQSMFRNGHASIDFVHEDKAIIRITLAGHNYVKTIEAQQNAS